MIPSQQSNINKQTPILESKRIFPSDNFANFFRLQVNLLLFEMCVCVRACAHVCFNCLFILSCWFFLCSIPCIDLLIYGFFFKKKSQATLPWSHFCRICVHQVLRYLSHLMVPAMSELSKESTLERMSVSWYAWVGCILGPFL